MNNQDFEESAVQESLADMINLPDGQRQIVTWIIRKQKMTIEEIIANVNLTKEVVQQHLDTLIFQGVIQESNDKSGTVFYQPNLINQKQSKLNQNIWDKL
ncbi:ArsR family transcriptional regulator [Nostocaceae cyanobacterium CENA369]|uniref:ArsR family transcriptional regulator n=1 Tax=Dendronalium phyllosphericum CENA369 TaxID=1725256 RepID=A0A8J7LG95_9NOST|nr:ArsR family transcriptional regulator [Dendronalium phyllosphericum]MBH8576787.1 ArsR family transcriptional regulator [Dendronalium phyllosphericum CENA369]